MTAYYLRPLKDGPFGTETGTSYANAWSTSSDIDWTVITAGDTLYICGLHDEPVADLINFVGMIAAATEGTALNPITISGNPPEEPLSGDIILSAKTLRNDDAWVDEGGGVFSYPTIVGGSAAHVYIPDDAVFMTDIGVVPTTESAPCYHQDGLEKFWYKPVGGAIGTSDLFVTGFNFISTTSNTYTADGDWTPSYLHFVDLKIRNASVAFWRMAHCEGWEFLRIEAGWSPAYAAIIPVDDANNGVVDDCDFHNMAAGVYSQGMSDPGYSSTRRRVAGWTVKNCHIHDIRRMDADNGDVHGIGWQSSDDCLWQNNTIENIYGTGITWFLTANRGGKNNRFTGNTIRNIDNIYGTAGNGNPAVAGIGIELTGDNTGRTGAIEYGNRVDNNNVSAVTASGVNAFGYGIKSKGAKDIGNGPTWQVDTNNISGCVHGLFLYSQNVDGGSADGEAGGIIQNNTVSNSTNYITYGGAATIAGYTVSGNTYLNNDRNTTMATEHIILAKTTSAGNSSSFSVKSSAPRTVYLFPVADLTVGENANLQRKDPDGTWQDVWDSGFKGSGGQVILDSTVTEVTVTGEGLYRVELENPTNAIGVAVSDQSGA